MESSSRDRGFHGVQPIGQRGRTGLQDQRRLDFDDLSRAAGGEDVFAALRAQKSAKDRIVAPEDVVAAATDVTLASWCGKKVVPDRIRQRPGWDRDPGGAERARRDRL